MQYILSLGLILFIAGCGSQKVEPLEKVQIVPKNIDIKKVYEKSKSSAIYDIVTLPQNIEHYTKLMQEELPLSTNTKIYNRSYFSAWRVKKPTTSLYDMKWSIRAFNPKNSYGVNLQPLQQSFFDKMIDNSNFDRYAKVNKKAITVRPSNIRALPTTLPLLRDPSKAGNGLAFDQLQNSYILANKPIFISHYSKDKLWAYIVSSFTYGWVKSSDIVTINEKHIKTWIDSEQIYITKEGEPLFTTTSKPLYISKIGMKFAIIKEKKNSYIVLVVKSYKGDRPLYLKAEISKSISSKERLKLNSKNINSIINEVSKTSYGWGGMYGERDCSSTMRDLFTPFGIWLPRNSSIQSRVGQVIDISQLTDRAKIELIKKEAIPFKTLIYKQGHIMLYVGVQSEQIVVFHNMWGLRTNKDGKKGRFVIGKSIFSTLEIGSTKDDFDSDSLLLKNLKSFNIL